MKQRYFIELAYNGTRFHGWQVQPNATSVQQSLEYALSTICREKIDVTGAGRTDTGVHASYFVAHFDSENPELDTPSFVNKLNSFLNADIAVFKLTKVADGAHARFDAASRTYRYFINQAKDPFGQETSWYFKYPLDVGRMNGACEILLGIHDFTSFSKLHTDVKTNICNVMDARWERNGNQLVFEIKADRFLRNMVRAIVGTMVLAGQGRITPDYIDQVIELKDRAAAGASVPPEGLFLTDISYPEEVFKGRSF